MSTVKMKEKMTSFFPFGLALSLSLGALTPQQMEYNNNKKNVGEYPY